ncbi:MAG: Gfo/Idh/MocA family oxidoreductase [Planctomycetota bacterium]
MGKKVRIAVVGLNFGSCFASIYQAHPDVELVGLCDSNEERLREAGDRLRVQSRHADLAEVLAGDQYNAVHICTPFTTHAPLCIRVMKAGKHCASAVPMGMTLEELRSVAAAQKGARVNYMMMETGIYHHVYLYAKELYRNGALGRIQLLRGTHSQDLEGLGDVWMGFPPMLYITHAISPLLDIADTRATKVHCLGSGTMREELVKNYGNPYPAATALFRLAGTSATIEITRTAFEIAPYGGEGFGVYGSDGSFMAFQGCWMNRMSPLVPGKSRGCQEEKNIHPPYRGDLLPQEIRAFAEGGHGESHAHLVHEFVRSIAESRPPYIDARRAANWCAPGICANESMLQEGEGVVVPVIE